jgi:light-regulated signal transduction histidine kinase (bacteriophytochrome)
MAAQNPLEQRPPLPPAPDSDAQHFAYIASHDLNAPLRAISGFVELLTAEYSDRLDDQGRDWLQRAVDSTHKMQGMLEDLRVYSRLTPAARRPVALAEVLAGVELELGEKIRETGAELSRGDLPTVHGDLAQLALLLRHLIDNALQYRSASAPRVRVAAEDRGDRWLVSVADNGIGVDPQHHARIFEMFKRLQPAPAYRGRGVGLALARRVVQLHGGELWIESELGAGAKFLFTLVKGTPAGG